MSGTNGCLRRLALLLILVAGFGVLAPLSARASVSPGDGFTRTSTAKAQGTFTALSGRLPVRSLKIMNYYPADAAWSSMWTDYSHSRTDADFADIAALGANTVRIIVQPKGVGWPRVTVKGASALRDMVDIADAHGLSVELTLFDLWGSFDDIDNSKAWAAQLLTQFAQDTRIVLVELKNEMTITDASLAWARQMLPYLRTLLPGVPRSLSANKIASLRSVGTLDPSLVDVVDVHLYGYLDTLPLLLATAHDVAAGRPVVVGEAGEPTPGGTAGSEQAQLAFYQSVAQLVADDGIGWFAPWTLTDFRPETVPPAFRTDTEVSYGLRRLDGSWKPATAVVRDMFAGADTLAFGPDELAATRIDYDGGFEREDATPSASGQLGSWRTFNASAAGSIGVLQGVGAAGSAAAALVLTGGDSSRVPAVYRSFLLLSGRRSVTVTGTVRLVNPTGSTRVAIAWFADGTYLGGRESVAAGLSTPNWQQLSVTGTAPAGATSFQIHLKSANNAGSAYWDDIRLS